MADQDATPDKQTPDKQIDDILNEPTPSPVEPEPVVRRGRWRLWLAAVVVLAAALVGWQAPQWLGLAPDTAALTAGLETRIAASEAEVAALKSELAALKAAPPPAAGVSAEDLAKVTEQVAALAARPGADPAAIDALAKRLTALERVASTAAPGTVPDTALAGLQAQLDQIKTAAEAADADLAARISALETAPTPVPEASAEPLAIVLAEIALAIDSGQPFASALLAVRDAAPDAEGLEALAAHATGVLTLTALREGFPDAARAALSAARAAETAEGKTSSRLGAFFKDQLGMRSLAPQDGADADAVLSRAEAALTSGDLAATLSELANLPASAAPAMADWVAQATARQDALDALAALQAGQGG